MGWAIGYDDRWKRDIGYGVPATCDHPGCGKKIDRGLGYVCCDAQPYGGDEGCGLYFCEEHRHYQFDEDDEDDSPSVMRCVRCNDGQPPFEPTPDVDEWTQFKATDPSWADWRAEQAGKQTPAS